jgi:hypothetical protein
MSTDGPTPAPCDTEIFQKGEGLCIVDGSSNAVERWVQAIAKKADAHVDWHYCGGRANVLHLGDQASRERALAAVQELEGELDGHIMSVGGPALFRNGVDQAPEGAVAYDPDLRAFMVEDPKD